MINGFGVLGGNSIANESYTSNINRITTISPSPGAAAHRALRRRLRLRSGQPAARSQSQRRLRLRFAGGLPCRRSPAAISRHSSPATRSTTAAVRELGFYVDAKLPVTKKLTVTAGLRWDGQWNPQPSHPNPAIAQTTYIPNDLSQWQPRLGIAWNPASNTVVRLSAGTVRCADAGRHLPARVYRQCGQHRGCRQLLRSADSAAGLFGRALHFAERAARRLDHACSVRGWHRAQLPQSAIVPGRGQRGAAVHSQDFRHCRICAQQHVGPAATAEPESRFRRPTTPAACRSSPHSAQSQCRTIAGE